MNQGIVVAPSVGLLHSLIAGEGIYTKNSIRDVGGFSAELLSAYQAGLRAL